VLDLDFLQLTMLIVDIIMTQMNKAYFFINYKLVLKGCQLFAKAAGIQKFTGGLCSSSIQKNGAILSN
jgi:hypothetical protein